MTTGDYVDVQVLGASPIGDFALVPGMNAGS